MRHPLEAIDWRIERADKYLATLNDERDRVVDEKNRRVVGEFKRDTSEYVFRFGGKLPEPRIGIVVGEFAHHLRSALDNLAWQLVLLRGGSPTRQTEFPIHESREGYERALRRGALRGVSADDRAAIQHIQPFHGGDSAADSYLALLTWLNNVDKHRFVHAGCAVASRFPIQVSYGAKGKHAGFFPWNPIPVKDVAEILDVDYVSSIASDDRAELMRVRIRTSGQGPKMDVRRDAAVEVAFSDPEQALSIRDLKIIRNLVVSIIDGLRPRFDVVAGAAYARKRWISPAFSRSQCVTSATHGPSL